MAVLVFPITAHADHSLNFQGGGVFHRWQTRHHDQIENMTMEALTTFCWRIVWVRRRSSYSPKYVMSVGIPFAAMVGCSPDNSSLTSAAPCMPPLIEPSESVPSPVGLPIVGTTDNGPFVRLRWDASSNTLGYRLYIGTRSKSYQQMVDAGPLTISVVSNLARDGTYYFAETAHNKSCPSN